MKNWKSSNLLFLALFSMLLVYTSCGDEDGLEDADYRVEVQIVVPEDGAQIMKDVPFTVEVAYTRDNDLIHNVSVDILNANGHSVKKLVEKHAHEKNNFTFKEEGITLEAAGTYTLRAMTTDMHDGDAAHGASGEHGSAEHSTALGDEHNMVEHTFTVL